MINVDTPISGLLSNGKSFTFTAKDVIDYVVDAKEKENTRVAGFPIDTIDPRWK